MPNPMLMLARISSIVALSVGLSACDSEAEIPLDPDDNNVRSQYAVYPSVRVSGSLGYRMNTNHAGNHFFSELDLHGAEHEETRLVEIIYDEPCGNFVCPVEVLAPTIQVVGGALTAQLANGGTINHYEFGQTRWLIETYEAYEPYPPMTMQYELTVEPSFDADAGTPTYNFYWDDGLGEGPISTCLMTGELPELTAAVFTDVDIDENTGEMYSAPGLLNIACTAGAAGKATSWRYHPAITVSLDEFQAAVRMVRADYCGDGQSWTYPGTPVMVEDKLGLNTTSLGGPYLPGQHIPLDEAVWNLDGAVCLDSPRAHASGPIVVSCNNGVIVWPCFWGAGSAFADPAATYRTASL